MPRAVPQPQSPSSSIRALHSWNVRCALQQLMLRFSGTQDNAASSRDNLPFLRGEAGLAELLDLGALAQLHAPGCHIPLRLCSCFRRDELPSH